MEGSVMGTICALLVRAQTEHATRNTGHNAPPLLLPEVDKSLPRQRLDAEKHLRYNIGVGCSPVAQR
jgi:hypothetical protein